MKLIKLFMMLYIAVFSVQAANAKEKLFVVERESSALAIIENDTLKGKMRNLHNLNHGVVKFRDHDGYLISRDGYVVNSIPKQRKSSLNTKQAKVRSDS